MTEQLHVALKMNAVSFMVFLTSMLNGIASLVSDLLACIFLMGDKRHVSGGLPRKFPYTALYTYTKKETKPRDRWVEKRRKLKPTPEALISFTLYLAHKNKTHLSANNVCGHAAVLIELSLIKALHSGAAQPLPL